MATKQTPKHGEWMGCTDTSAPEKHTNEQLSRVYDVLDLAECAQVKMEVWQALPYTLRFEFNYSKWQYVSR